MGVAIVEGGKVERIATALEGIAGGLRRVTLTITMVSVDEDPVYDENVIVTDLSTGNVLYTIPYNRAPVQVELAQDKSYSVTGTQDHLAETTFYAPTTVGGVAQSDANITITYQVLDAANSLMAIQKMVQDNPGKEILPIGTEVTVPYVNESGTEMDNTLVLVHYGYYVKEADKDTGTLTWMAIFMAKYASDASITFDAPEVEAATESVAAAGITYYGKNGTTYTRLTLEQGDTIPYGDYEAIYHNEINDSSANIVRYGYNRWSHSAYRQYLNSSAAVGSWWTAQHLGDMAPAELGAKRGYMAGWRTEDLMAVQSIKIVTAKNTVTDDGTLEETYDKFWLPSIKEMYGVEQLAGEGDVWYSYWRDYIGLGAVLTNAANALRKIFQINNHTSAQYVRLRSAYRGYSNNVWNVYASGEVNANGAYNAYRCAPACAIG